MIFLDTYNNISPGSLRYPLSYRLYL